MKNVEGLRYKRTLFVGLGGAGAKTLRKLKSKIQEANGGKVPKQIRFLLIDTNATDLSNYRDFDSSEKVCIAVREPYQRYIHDLGTATHKYIPEQNTHSLLALERGAGQIRSNGHFAVIENQFSNKLSRVFRERADELEDIDVKGNTLEKDPKIEVRLVFSIAGGTGGGTFLPIATIIRSAISHCELTAYIYSATHYSKKVENSAKYSVMQNAYASLCELDYMMHFGRDKRHEKITFNFGPDERQRIEQANRPFDEVYYIDKHTSYPTSDSVEFAYNEVERLQDNTAESMHLSATNVISAHTGTVDNVRQKIMEGQFDVGDKFAWISGMGLAELYLKPLDDTNPEVVKTCCNSIFARTNPDATITTEAADDIASEFIKLYKWNEAGGDEDGDPILQRFVTKNEIENKCKDEIYPKNQLSDSYRDFNLSLKSILTSKNKNADIIVSESIQEFGGYVTNLLKSLVDTDSFGGKHVIGYSGKGPGISLNSIRLILEKINEKLNASHSKIFEEEKTHKKLCNDLDADLQTLRKSQHVAPVQNQGFWNRIFGNNNQPQQIQPNLQILAADIKKLQHNALYNFILSERDSKTLEIFAGCIEKVNDAIKVISVWREFLDPAYTYGQERKNKNEQQISEDTYVKENRVEVQMTEVQGGFRIKYADITRLANMLNVYQSDQAKFGAIRDLLTAASGSLRDYLAAGLNEIEKLVDDNRKQIERTECQQKIDRLIDLSTPTMQVDGHGYGERINLDHFWYIMTDCPEENISRKDDSERTKSVGALLKTLIEQNSLDAKINLVHVPGWNNKAILYRVDSAIPPYFVEGVCFSSETCYTLEGCYEELKKTKRTYTPFSHDLLRQKLENRVSVLKPNDGMVESEAMEHWLNFNLLGFIHFESKKGTSGQYSVWSKKLGEVLTDNLNDNNHILILGQTRQEAFDTFTRYSKSLVEEYSEVDDIPLEHPYDELIDPYDYASIDEYSEKFIMNGNAYFGRIFSAETFVWHGDLVRWEELNAHLTKENIDYEILRKEMEAMDDRLKRFNKEQLEKKKAESTSKSYDESDDTI